MANHFDMLPTFAAIVGGQPKEADQLHGKSLVPLMKDPKAEWEDRYRFFHIGRWKKDANPTDSMGDKFAVRNQRFRMVGRNELYDMEADPSQKNNVIESHPETAKAMNAAYDVWFKDAIPNMVNEDATLDGHNTFHTMFWKQYDMEVPPVKTRKKKNNKKKNKKD